MTNEIDRNQNNRQPTQLESPPASTVLTSHANDFVDSEDELMDELEDIVQQACSTGPTEGSRKASLAQDDESVVCLADCRTPTEREDDDHLQSSLRLERSPALCNAEDPSNGQQATRLSAQLESPPASILLTPQADVQADSEDELMDEIEGIIEQAWSNDPLEGSRKASLSQNDESVVSVSDCYAPRERKDESPAQSSLPLAQNPALYSGDVPSNRQHSIWQAVQFETSPASMLLTPLANDYMESDDELMDELEGTVQKACSTGLLEAEATAESDGESVVCLSDSPAPTQREWIGPGFTLQPYALCSAKVPALYQEIPCQALQQDSAPALSLLPPHLNVSADNEEALTDEIEELVEQARWTGTEAECRSATVESDDDSVICLSDGPAPTQREGIIPELRLPPPAPLCYAEVPASVRQIQYQTSQFESPLAQSALMPNVHLRGDSDGSELVRPHPPLCYHEGPWNYAIHPYQASQLEAPFAPTKSTRAICVPVEVSTPMLLTTMLPASMRLTQTEWEANDRTHWTPAMHESGGAYGSGCYEKPSVSSSQKSQKAGRWTVGRKMDCRFGSIQDC